MALSKQRLEALSDGVIAIIITIMVLSLPTPEEATLKSLAQQSGSFLIYFISFIVVGAFWSQHSRIFSYIDTVNDKVTWINLLFLFFLSLIPFFTKWVIDNPDHIAPVVGYDITYICVNLSYVFIFSYVTRSSEHPEIKALRDERRKLNKPQPSMLSWIRFFLTLAVIATIVVVSISFPKIATVLLLGFPVVSSLANLVLDKSKRRPAKQTA